jgi:hypothetical protein
MLDHAISCLASLPTSHPTNIVTESVTPAAHVPTVYRLAGAFVDGIFGDWTNRKIWNTYFGGAARCV